MSASTLPVTYSEAQRREAADWFVVIQGEIDPAAESMQAWLRWMDQHEGNRAAFDAVARAWHATPSSSGLFLPSTEEIEDDDYDGEESVAEWLARQQRDGSASTPAATRTKLSSIPKRAWLAAASVLMAVTGLFLLHRHLTVPAAHADEFTTRIGEQIEITLADGSHVWLGPQSTLRVDFTPEKRGIHLANGEAFFSVKKDPRRPFAVLSAGGDIVAVGTSFNVRAVDDHVTVAVAEGVVAVTPKAEIAAPKAIAVRVAMGQELTFKAQQPIQALAVVESPAPGERGRWRDGVLVYRNERLHEVIDDVVRHSNVQIEIADAAVGEMHYSGVIYHDAVREWVSALPESFPVTVVSEDSREIIKAR